MSRRYWVIGIVACTVTSASAQVSLTVQYGHQGTKDVVVNHEGTLAASPGPTGRLHLWEVDGGAMLRINGDGSRPIAFSRDSRRLATAGGPRWYGPGRLEVRKVPSLDVELTIPIPNYTFPPDSEFSHDGKLLAYLYFEDTKKPVKIVEIASGKTLHELDCIHLPVFAPDDRSVMCTRDKDYRLEVHTLAPRSSRVLEAGAARDIYDMAMSADGRALVTMHYDLIEWRDVPSGKLLFSHKTWTSYGDKVVFAADGKSVLFTHHGGVTRWDGRTTSIVHPEDQDEWAIVSGNGVRFLVGGRDRGVTVGLTATNATIATHTTHITHLIDAAASPIGDVIAVAGIERQMLASGRQGTIMLWDLASLGMRRRLLAPDTWSIAFSPDGKQLAAGKAPSITPPAGQRVDWIQIWDADTGAARSALTRDQTPSSNMSSPRIDKLWFRGSDVIGSLDGRFAVIWERATGKLVREFELKTGSSHGFDVVGPRIVVANSPNDPHRSKNPADVFATDLDGGALQRLDPMVQGRAHADRVWDALAISGDGKRALSGGWDGVVKLWDLDTRKVIHELQGHQAKLTAVAFSHDAGRALSADASGALILWDLATGKRVRPLVGHTGEIRRVEFVRGRELAVSVETFGVARLWNLATGQSVALLARDEDWIAFTDDGYFDASRRGGSLVAAVRGLRAYSVEQLAVRNNRPDILLQRLGLGTKDAVSHFEGRYKRRLVTLGIEEAALSTQLENAPVATIDNIDHSGATATITARLAASSAELLRYNLYANGVPVLGALGKQIGGRSQVVTEPIELAPGRNLIEIAVIDASGIESLRDARTVDLAGEATGDLYVVGFGVSRYRDPDLALKYAHKDIEDVAHYARSARTGFANVHVETYVDQQVDTAAFARAETFLGRARPGDTVVVVVAGHGVYSEGDQARYYYLPYATDRTRLEATAIEFSRIEDLVQHTPARKKLLLLDTCESGERVAGEVAVAADRAGSRGLRSRGLRRVDKTASAPRTYLLDRNRYIYNDIARRSGAIVLSSSEGTELSYETDEDQNGVFTEAVLAALTTPAGDTDRDGRITTDELRTFVRTTVATRTGDLQHPTVDRDNASAVISLPVVKDLAFPRATTPSASSPPPVAPSPRGCGCESSEPSWVLVLGVMALLRRRRTQT